MDANPDPRPRDLPAEPPAPPGELVVRNGRLRGTRCPLRAPLTLLGRGDDCDVRLNVDGVAPLHCALSLGPQGVSLRHLGRKHRTLVNGHPATAAPLRDGDSLTVGPCRFHVRLTPAAAPTPPPPADHPEKDALRIQAAAVAAQQAALFEEETRLHQRRLALERQEKELVTHLEEKRGRLLEAHAQVRQSHAAMQEERARYEQCVAALARQLETDRRDLADGRHQLQAERRRLLRLRQHLKRRWHRSWAAERAAMQRREQALRQQAGRLDRDKEAFAEARRRFHGTAELERRQLQDQREQLCQEQKRWEHQYVHESAELAERSQALDQREANLAAAERAWAEQQQHREATRTRLEREIQGLENRIRHQRPELRVPDPEPHWPLAAPNAAPPPALLVVAPAPGSPAPADEGLRQCGVMLEAVAGELADQRLHLLEHWQRLLQTHQLWQHERDTVTRELAALGLRLQEREQALARAVEHCRQRHDELRQLRHHLDGRQAQLTVQALTGSAERDRWHAELQAREDHLARRLAGLDRLHQLRQQRYQQGVTRLRAEYAACDRLRQEYSLLRRQWLRRTEALADEEKDLARRALTVEQYRQKYLDQAADPAAARKRLDGLQQRVATLFARVGADCRAHREALRAELARLEDRHRAVSQGLEEVAAREAALSGRETAWEQQQALADDETARLRRETQRLQAQRESYEQQITGLRDEVERLALRLLTDDDFAGQGIGQAA